MIILYEYTETAFTNNGLGCLNDATSCVVSETLNGEYELEMEYPVNGIHYSDIQLRRIIFAKPNSYDREQPFRIYSISKPIGGLVTVNAEHISYDMSGLPVRGAIEHYAWYVNDVFDHIKNNSVYPCPFTFSSDITEEKKAISLSKPRSVKAFLGTDEGLLSLFGGEWEFDRYNAILHKERGQNRGVSIEYGKNLTDVTQDEACSEMYTAVYPYYYKEDDGLQRLDEDIVKILDTPYNNVCVLDLTSEFDEMPTQDQLRAKTREYIKDNKLGEPKVSLKVSFIKNPEVIEALQDVRLGDTVGVKFIKIGVNTTSRCINYEFNVITNQYNSIGLGEPTKTIVDTMTSTSIRIDAANSAIDDTQNDLNDTKDDLTDEIDRATGAEGALSTRITKTEEGLETEVTRAQGAENYLGSRITQTAESITAEVSKKVGEDEIRSKFAMSPENVTIESGSINFNSNTIGIDSDNFGLDSDTGETKFYGEQTFYEDKSMSTSGRFGYGYIDGMSSPLGFYFNKNLYVNKNKVALEKNIPDTSKFAPKSSPTLSNATLTGNIDAIGIKGRSSSASANVRCQDGSSTGYLAIAATSSKRYKHDIADITDPKLDPHRLLRLHARQYKYNLDYLDPEDTRYDEVVCGFVAEEVLKQYPVACEFNAYGMPENWDARYIIPPMLSLIQEQHLEIESLKLENLQIKGELDILKQKLKRLEEKLC